MKKHMRFLTREYFPDRKEMQFSVFEGDPNDVSFSIARGLRSAFDAELLMVGPALYELAVEVMKNPHTAPELAEKARKALGSNGDAFAALRRERATLVRLLREAAEVIPSMAGEARVPSALMGWLDNVRSIDSQEPGDQERASFVERAREQFCTDKIAVESSAVVVEGYGGHWVQAWLLVTTAEASATGCDEAAA